jgi:hypothetical protein
VARNTGRNSRIGAVKGRSQVQNPRTGSWTKRNTTDGRFLDVKETPGAYKGVRREK